jgi:hypothetical protein
MSCTALGIYGDDGGLTAQLMAYKNHRDLSLESWRPAKRPIKTMTRSAKRMVTIWIVGMPAKSARSKEACIGKFSIDDSEVIVVEPYPEATKES